VYVYILSEKFLDLEQVQRELWTVGFYKPDGSFEAESDHSSKEEAASRVHYLNGGIKDGGQGGGVAVELIEP
jgi:hypothetical protein